MGSIPAGVLDGVSVGFVCHYCVIDTGPATVKTATLGASTRCKVATLATAVIGGAILYFLRKRQTIIIHVKHCA